MTDHVARFERPSGYSARYACSCGWESDTVPSEDTARIGAQLVRHMRGEPT